MESNINRVFTLDNSLAAVSAFVRGEDIFSTDGIECIIHRIGSDCDQCITRTLRPYRRLRRSESGQITGLGCCESTRLYFLSDCFNETGYVTLDTSRSACGCDLGILTDASLTTIGSESFIVGAFEKNAYLFDMNGKRLTRLCTAERGEVLSDFISLGNDLFAMSTLKGNLRTVTVTDNGKTFSGILNKSHSLRMLFSVGNDIFGLFGQSYIYNRILKIYSCGEFTLPETQGFCE